VFFQLTASDPAATYAFLDALFGWERAEPDERGTISIRAGGPADFDVTGVLMPQRAGRQQATLFFRVEDLQATVTKAEELGGQIVMSIRRSTPTGPHLAIVSTPGGELNVGIVQA
jgi:predicted enzyme related to lactoylglutathione lyase